MDLSRPASWAELGSKARPNLHGMLRYPAMMVPRMQGDIIDTIVAELGDAKCRVIDPFVGSGTVMTEALLRGIDFTGVDINPLAVLACEAKASIDAGTDIERAGADALAMLSKDFGETIDVKFPFVGKWFDEPVAVRLSRIRRAIMTLDDPLARKVMWTVFAETIRVSSNSRTSTYKLHLRPADDRVTPDRVVANFEAALRQTIDRVAAYRSMIAKRAAMAPDVRIMCGDVRKVAIGKAGDGHRILVTSPPYGDNRTTIPYGQSSYLALRWIPEEELKGPRALLDNAFALDTASLGGSLRDVVANEERMAGVSPTLDSLVKQAPASGPGKGLRKVVNFMADLFDAFVQVRAGTPGSAHWVVTTGNRTAHGIHVPLDDICREMLEGLGGKAVASLRRPVPGKRMPTKNNIGQLINTETTLVVEFA